MAQPEAMIQRAGNGEATSAVVAALARHDERRRQGVPTVSVLVAPISPVLEVASRWAESLGRPMVFVRSEALGVEPVLAPWIARLVAERDLVDQAIGWLGRTSGRPVEQLVQSLGKMTPHEVGLFLESALPLSSQTGVESVVRYLLGDAASARWRPGSEHRLAVRSLVQGCGGSWFGVYAALGEMVLEDDLPVLVVTPGRREVSRLEEDAKLLTSLAIAQPRAAILLVVHPGQFDAYVAMTPASRAKDLLCESVVKLSFPGPSTGAQPSVTPAPSCESANPDPEPGSSETAVLGSGSWNLELDDDPARSAAERMLFDSLELLPETAGLFELNGTLDFCFGCARRIEVDLVARSLKLAVEIDGYHHFQDLEAYRRDRRKDLELQKHGYLVARVLADDVIDRPENVMDIIRALVAFCRESAQKR